MIRFLLQTLRLLAISGLAGATWVAHRPAPLPETPPAANARVDDLADLMQQAAIKRAAVMVVSQDELNRHLARTLSGRVRNPFGDWAAFDGIRVDLQPDVARVHLIWNIKGHIRTASVDLAVSRDADNHQVDVLRGAYGHLELPRGMMRPLYPVLRAVAEVLDPEIRALFQMTKITVAEDKLMLDPRFLP